MADERERQEGYERESWLSSGFKIAAVAATGVGIYRNRHGLASSMMEMAAKHGAQGHGLNNAVSEAGLRARTVLDAMGERPGAVSLARSFKDPSEFERRARLAYRANRARQEERNTLSQAPNMGKRAMEYMSAQRQLHQEAVQMARREFGVKQMRANDTLAKQMDTGLEELLIRENMFKTGNVTEKNVYEFTVRHNSKEAREKQNFHLNLKDNEEEKKFAQELFDNLNDVKDRITIRQDTTKRAYGERMSDDEIKFVDQRLDVMEKAQFEALMEELSKPRNETFLSKSLGERGYEQLTFKDIKDDKEFIQSVAPIERDGAKAQQMDFVKRIQDQAERFGVEKERLDGLVVDPYLFKDKAGKRVDAMHVQRAVDQGFDFVHGNFQIPLLNFNPVDLIQYGAIKASRNAPAFRVFGRGDVNVFSASDEYKKMEKNFFKRNDQAVSTGFADDYLYAGGASFDLNRLTKALDEVGGDITKLDLSKGKIEDGLVLVSNEFGLPKRFAESVAGFTSIDKKENALRKIWGGHQENESIFGRIYRGTQKRHDERYGPNLLARIHQTEDLTEMQEIYNRIHSTVNRGTRGMSHDAGYYFDEHMQKAMKAQYGVDIDFNSMRNTEEGVLDAVQKIANAAGWSPASPNKQGLRSFLGAEEDVLQMYRNYEQNPALFMRQQTTLPDKAPITSEMVNIAAVGYDRMMPQTEDLRKTIERLALQAIPTASGNSVHSLIEEGIKSGKLAPRYAQEVMDLENLSKIRSYRSAIREQDLELNLEGLESFKREFSEGTKAYEELMGTMKRKDPWYGAGPGQEPVDHYGENVHFQMIKRHRGLLESINAATAEEAGFASGASAAWKYAKSMSAGRKNIEDITTGTMVPWFFASRLDDAMAQMGMGLSNKHRGSALSIVGNQWGRRIVLPYVAYQQAMYLDGLTGDMVSDEMADTYVNMHKDVARAKDVLGITDFGASWRRVFAGSDQMDEWVPNKLFNFATFGALSDFRSEEEVEEYYVSGEDAIRKGRYWAIGSTTPWMGGKIERYQPNWYRRMKSDYMFSENALGSESEYWANHWMPTLTNPLAPLNHFVLDPYHYERKHKDERPFAVTGGFASLNNIPLIGPAIDNTVGRVLKPRIEDGRLTKAHHEYLEAYNERLSMAYMTANSGAMVEEMPGGGVRLTGNATGLDFQSEMAMEGLSEHGYGMNGMVGTTGETGGGAGIEGMSGGQGAGMARYDLEQMNLSMQAAANTVNRGFGSLEAAIDPHTVYDMNNVIRQDSLTDMRFGTGRDVFYNASEMAGIFGFSFKTLAGFEESERGPTLQDSSLFGSYNKKFWDMELGGFGGDISEIARRYMARDPNKNYYNPIRNTMPDWMPGPEYFTDFLHGDPYSRIAMGEMRLPGEAYEKLYNVKKDAMGNYSTLDRVRILADVAPYSEQYRQARKEMSILNQHGLLSDAEREEYATIREQTTARKAKKLFYERRFNAADVTTETVTVTKVLDAETFITREYGESNPLKLAGVNIKADDEAASAFVGQFIKEGAELKVQLDADPMFKERDDMMNTMRAIVFTPENEEGNPFYLTTKGANLNFMLANRPEFKDTVKVVDDGSATATRALFTKDQITVGRMWDWAVRDVAPQVPVLGIFADKFLQVRSPVESYERELYSKTWRPWQEPIEGWLKPMFDTVISRNPVVGAAGAYWIGRLAGRGRGSGVLGLGMGLGVGVLSSIRALHDVGADITGAEQWVPKRRTEQRELDEYFDRLRYLKYRGLYERAADLALENEGIDIRSYLREREFEGRENKTIGSFLDEQKKRLNIQKKSGYGDVDSINGVLKEYNGILKDINENRSVTEVGPYAALALRFKDEYESTIYAVGTGESMDFQKLFRAMPAMDRNYFTEFMKAAPRDREKILRLVPEYQKAIYQRAWGLETDEPEDMARYFRSRNLPELDWDGWDPNESLDAVKIKVMQNEGMELTEANYWNDDEWRAERTDIEPVRMKKAFGSVDTAKLTKVLRGAGLSDVQVTMATMPSERDEIRTEIDLQVDRTKEVASHILSNWDSLLS